jgi:hypothetical protein
VSLRLLYLYLIFVRLCSWLILLGRSGRMYGDERSTQRLTSSRNMPRARPVAVRGKPTVHTNRPCGRSRPATSFSPPRLPVRAALCPFAAQSHPLRVPGVILVTVTVGVSVLGSFQCTVLRDPDEQAARDCLRALRGSIPEPGGSLVLMWSGHAIRSTAGDAAPDALSGTGA